MSWPMSNKRYVGRNLTSSLPWNTKNHSLESTLRSDQCGVFFVFFALKKGPVGKNCGLVVLWFSLFKLSINQMQALMYTSLCPWDFIALLCGPCFPSQTFVGSYSLHPVPLIGQSELVVEPFLQPNAGAPFSINRYLPCTAAQGDCRKTLVCLRCCVWKALTALQVLLLMKKKSDD